MGGPDCGVGIVGGATGGATGGASGGVGGMGGGVGDGAEPGPVGRYGGGVAPPEDPGVPALGVSLTGSLSGRSLGSVACCAIARRAHFAAALGSKFPKR